MDLDDPIEERWAGTNEDRFEGERELLKPMQIGDRRVTAPAGPRTEAAKRVVDAVLGDRPGIRAAGGDVAVEGSDVVVRFPEPDETPPRSVEGRDVACLLNPPS